MSDEFAETPYPWIFLIAILAAIAIGSIVIPACTLDGVGSGETCTVEGRVFPSDDEACSSSSSSEGGGVRVLEHPTEGGFVSVAQFTSTNPIEGGCDEEHYHATNAPTTVVKCDGSAAGNPNSTTCGFGKVSDIIAISSCDFP